MRSFVLIALLALFVVAAVQGAAQGGFHVAQSGVQLGAPQGAHQHAVHLAGGHHEGQTGQQANTTLAAGHSTEGSATNSTVEASTTGSNSTEPSTTVAAA